MLTSLNLLFILFSVISPLPIPLPPDETVAANPNPNADAAEGASNGGGDNPLPCHMKFREFNTPIMGELKTIWSRSPHLMKLEFYNTMEYERMCPGLHRIVALSCSHPKNSNNNPLLLWSANLAQTSTKERAVTLTPQTPQTVRGNVPMTIPKGSPLTNEKIYLLGANLTSEDPVKTCLALDLDLLKGHARQTSSKFTSANQLHFNMQASIFGGNTQEKLQEFNMKRDGGPIALILLKLPSSEADHKTVMEKLRYPAGRDVADKIRAPIMVSSDDMQILKKYMVDVLMVADKESYNRDESFFETKVGNCFWAVPEDEAYGKIYKIDRDFLPNGKTVAACPDENGLRRLVYTTISTTETTNCDSSTPVEIVSGRVPAKFRQPEETEEEEVEEVMETDSKRPRLAEDTPNQPMELGEVFIPTDEQMQLPTRYSTSFMEETKEAFGSLEKKMTSLLRLLRTVETTLNSKGLGAKVAAHNMVSTGVKEIVDFLDQQQKKKEDHFLSKVWSAADVQFLEKSVFAILKKGEAKTLSAWISRYTWLVLLPAIQTPEHSSLQCHVCRTAKELLVGHPGVGQLHTHSGYSLYGKSPRQIRSHITHHEQSKTHIASVLRLKQLVARDVAGPTLTMKKMLLNTPTSKVVRTVYFERLAGLAYDRHMDLVLLQTANDVDMGYHQYHRRASTEITQVISARLHLDLLGIKQLSLKGIFDVRWSASHLSAAKSLIRMYPAVLQAIHTALQDSELKHSQKVSLETLQRTMKDLRVLTLLGWTVDLLSAYSEVSATFQREGETLFTILELRTRLTEKLRKLQQHRPVAGDETFFPGTFMLASHKQLQFGSTNKDKNCTEYKKDCLETILQHKGLDRIGLDRVNVFFYLEPVEGNQKRQKTKIYLTTTDTATTSTGTRAGTPLSQNPDHAGETQETYEEDNSRLSELYTSISWSKTNEMVRLPIAALVRDLEVKFPQTTSDTWEPLNPSTLRTMATMSDEEYERRITTATVQIVELAALMEESEHTIAYEYAEWCDSILRSSNAYKELLLLQTTTPQQFYHTALSTMKNYPTMRRLVTLALTVPVSSADAERAFSILFLIRTERRSRVSAATIDGELRLRMNGPDLENFNPQKCR